MRPVFGEFMKIPKIVAEVLGSRFRIGKAMLDWAKDGRLTKHSQVEFCEALNIKSNPYYDMLKFLRRLNLIYLDSETYRLNKNWSSEVVKEWIQYLLDGN